METEVFLVMPNRKNNEDLPKVEKTIGMEMFWTKEDAQNCLDKIKSVGPYYGIYAAIIKVHRRL